MSEHRDEPPAPTPSEISDLNEPDDEQVKGGATIVPCVRPPSTIIPCIRDPRTIIPCVKPGTSR